MRVARVLEGAGYDVQPKAFFDTITVEVGALPVEIGDVSFDPRQQQFRLCYLGGITVIE